MVYKVSDRPSSGQPWTDECVHAVREMINRGESIRDIAKAIGRSQEAIRARAHLNGMMPKRAAKVRQEP